ncbi:MAG: DUF2812 domain-containing protein [Clostridium sp.]|uniref:DUF2812 domain-containing protein n=1 Tax=Clostridium sp. TaxID=1506 RepID=UPI003F2E8287
MRIGDYKWVVFNLLPYEYKNLEKYLESMALKGWKLQNIMGVFLKFKKIVPKKIKYSVDVVSKVSVLEGKNSDIALEYREYCITAGWTFVCERDKLQIYCSDDERERVPIHTDEKEKFNIICKASITNILLYLLTPVIVLLTQYVIIKSNYNASFLANNVNVVLLIGITLLMIYEVIGLINFIIWYIKSKIRIERGEAILETSPISAKVREQIHKVAFIVILINVPLIIYSYIGTYNELKDTKYPLEISDFNIKSSGEDSTYASENNGVLASTLFYSETNNNLDLFYELFESKYEWAVNYDFKKIIDNANENNIKYNEIKTDLPSSMKCYKNKNDNYIIKSNNKLLEISNNENKINEEILLNKIYDNIFK